MQKKFISTKHKFFISYLSFFLVPCLILGTLAYVLISHSMTQTSKLTYDNISFNLCNTFDNKMDDLLSFTFRLSEASWVKSLMYMQEREISQNRIDITTVNEYVAQLETFCGSSNFASYMAICFFDKNFVISSAGQVSFENFIQYDFRIKDMETEKWKSILTDLNYKKLMFAVSATQISSTSQGIVFLQSYPVNNFTEPHAVLVAFIPYDRMDQIIREQLPSSNIAYTLSAEEKPLFSVGETGRNTYLTQSSSPYGFSLSLAVPHRLISAGLMGLRITFLVLFLLLIGLGYLLSHTMAERSYRPLEKLIATLAAPASASSGKAKNEFLLLEEAISYLMEQENKLSNTLNKHAPMLREAYIQKLLTAQTELTEEYFKTLDLFGVRFPYPWINCMVIENTADAVRLRIEQILKDIGCVFYQVVFQKSQVFLLNFPDLKIQETLIKTLNQTPFCGVVIGIGSCRSDLLQFSASYEEAKQASQYRLFRTQTSVIEYSELLQGNEAYFYPADFEFRLSQALENGNTEQCKNLLTHAVEKNLKDKPISPSFLSQLIYGLCITAVHICSQHHAGLQMEFNKINALAETSTEAAIQYLFTFYEKGCRLIREKSESAKEDTTNQIIEYVNRHLTDPSLSLSMVADAFHLQPSNMSKLFKVQYHMRFIDYVSAQRIAQAKKLLQENELDVSSIARQVGYDSDVTFRRVFKKITGTSPSQFRGEVPHKQEGAFL